MRRVSARTRTGAGAVPTALALTRSRFRTKSNFAADVGATRTLRRSARLVAHGLVRATLRTPPEGGARSPGRRDEEIPRASSLRRASDEIRRAVARRMERTRSRASDNSSAGNQTCDLHRRQPLTANRPREPPTQTAAATATSTAPSLPSVTSDETRRVGDPHRHREPPTRNGRAENMNASLATVEEVSRATR